VSGNKLVLELNILGDISILKDVVALNEVLIPDTGHQLTTIDQTKLTKPVTKPVTEPVTEPVPRQQLSTLYYKVN
jgi:hypothetical protein